MSVFEAPVITKINNTIANTAKIFDKRHNHRMPLKRTAWESSSEIDLFVKSPQECRQLPLLDTFSEMIQWSGSSSTFFGRIGNLIRNGLDAPCTKTASRKSSVDAVLFR